MRYPADDVEKKVNKVCAEYIIIPKEKKVNVLL